MCEMCKGLGWIEKKNGMRECACRKAATKPEPKQMRLDELAAISCAAADAAEHLGAMPDYPNGFEKPAREAVADALRRMCSTPQQVEWVVTRALHLHPSWKKCGIPGLRQILISKYPACDGIESGPQCISEAFPEGIPSERDNLTGYQAATVDKLLEESAYPPKRLAAGVDQPKPDYVEPPPPPRWHPPEPPPIPQGKEITQADIDRELEKRKKP